MGNLVGKVGGLSTGGESALPILVTPSHCFSHSPSPRPTLLFQGRSSLKPWTTEGHQTSQAK